MLSFCHNETVVLDTIRLWEPDSPSTELATVLRCGKCLKPCGTLKMKSSGIIVDGGKILELLNKERGNAFTRLQLGLPHRMPDKKSPARLVSPESVEPDIERDEPIDDPIDDEEALLG